MSEYGGEIIARCETCDQAKTIVRRVPMHASREDLNDLFRQAETQLRLRGWLVHQSEKPTTGETAGMVCPKCVRITRFVARFILDNKIKVLGFESILKTVG